MNRVYDCVCFYVCVYVCVSVCVCVSMCMYVLRCMCFVCIYIYVWGVYV